MTPNQIYTKMAYHFGELAKLSAMLSAESHHDQVMGQEKAAAQNGKDVPDCKCGVPALYQSGESKDGSKWERYVCAKPPRDPNNCKFKQWID